MKHIVLYVNSMAPSGGIERVISTLAAQLRGQFRISILVKDQPISFYKLPDNVEIHTLQYELIMDMNSRTKRIFSLFFHLFGIGKVLNKKIKELNPDYLYITTPFACLEIILAGIPKHKVIISEHCSRKNYNSVYRFLQRILYRKFNVQVVPTSVDFNWYRENKYPSFYIPHFRSNMPYEKANLNSNTVLNIGRLTDDKNQISLLRIWKEVMKNEGLLDWQLKIVGNGENYNLLTKYINEENIINVEIVNPIPNVEEYYKNSSIYVSSSKSEGFPMVLVEAISFGLPTLAYDCPTGPNEILAENSGVLIELGDESFFVVKLVEMMNNYALRLEYSERAFNRSVNWGEDVILNKWTEILL